MGRLEPGTRVRVCTGPRRGAAGELIGYAADDTIAYVRIRVGPTRRAVVAVRADSLTTAQDRPAPPAPT